MIEADSEVPETRCDFQPLPQNIDHLWSSSADLGMKPSEWQEGVEMYCCWRKVWRDGKCIWHADVEDKPISELLAARTGNTERLDGAILLDIDLSGLDFGDTSLSGACLRRSNLSNSNLHGTNLQGAYLPGANLKSSNLRWADLSHSILIGANLKDAHVNHADLPHANLFGADLINTDFRDADLTEAELEEADLTDSDLRGVELNHAQLFQSVLSDIRIDTDTDFGEKCVYERPGIEPRSGDLSGLQAAVWNYGQLERLCQDTALINDVSKYCFRKVEAHRKYLKNEGNRLSYIAYTLNRRISKHNESPTRVIGWSVATVILCGFTYPFLGGMRPAQSNNAPITFFNLFQGFPFAIPDWLEVISANLYFSAVTFTTLGYGDIQPASKAAQTLASVESFVGLF